MERFPSQSLMSAIRFQPRMNTTMVMKDITNTEVNSQKSYIFLYNVLGIFARPVAMEEENQVEFQFQGQLDNDLLNCVRYTHQHTLPVSVL